MKAFYVTSCTGELTPSRDDVCDAQFRYTELTRDMLYFKLTAIFRSQDSELLYRRINDAKRADDESKLRETLAVPVIHWSR